MWVSATVGTCLRQRGHAVPTALWMALRARGSAPNITALQRLWVCWSVSSQGGVPPWLKSTRLAPGASGRAVMSAVPPFAQGRFAPRAAHLTSPLCVACASVVQSVAPASPGPACTRLSRGFGLQRGHVGRAAFCLSCAARFRVSAPNITAFRQLGVCGFLVSGHGGVPPWPGSTGLSRSHSCFCGARPLRPHAALLHNAAFWKVLASRCAKAPLGVAHRCAPSRVSKTGVMQSGLRLGTVAQPSALPGRWRALRTAARRPGGCRCSRALVRRFAHGSS